MSVGARRFVVWDFDGTLAHRPEQWSGAVLAAVRAAGLACSATAAEVRPFLQSGFPWHQHHIVRAGEQAPDAWWSALNPVFEYAICALTGVAPAVAEEVAGRVRGIYTDPRTWILYADTVGALELFSAAGWTQLVLSNHVPELPAILEALGVRSHFGDSMNADIVPAEAAGMRAVLGRSTHAAAARCCESLADVMTWRGDG